MSERAQGLLTMAGLVAALLIAASIVTAPLWRARAERIETRARIEAERWQIEAPEYQKRQERITTAIVVFCYAILATVALFLIVIATCAGVLAYRTATQRAIVRQISRSLPAVIGAVVYDPLTGAATEIDHAQNGTLLPAEATRIALTRDAAGAVRAEIVPVSESTFESWRA